MLGFALGGALLLPIGYVYGQLVRAMPDAAGEIAYTAAVFPRSVSFATGWTMLLAYYIVCPWEAVAIGRIASYVFPAMNSFELYRVAGKPVFLPHLVIGLALTGSLTVMNYRAIRMSASFQNVTAFGAIALVATFIVAGLRHGSTQNLQPLFSASAPLSILLVLQIVPYFMTGFESIGKASEEASSQFQPRRFLLAIMTAMLVGIAFYVSVIAATSYVAPWQSLVHEPFATAVAFEHAIGTRWIVNVIMCAAVLSLLEVFNGNFVAATRLLFALGRRGLADTRLGYVHPNNRTPAVAVVSIGLFTAICMFAGESILVPIAEVGSLASALGWMAACASYVRMKPSAFGRTAAATGIVVTFLVLVMKILPTVPGHFSIYEWMALALWIVLGLLLHRKPERSEAAAISDLG
jgi:APA family basic amino acid/polyamine antiporter